VGKCGEENVKTEKTKQTERWNGGRSLRKEERGRRERRRCGEEFRGKREGEEKEKEKEKKGGRENGNEMWLIMERGRQVDKKEGKRRSEEWSQVGKEGTRSGRRWEGERRRRGSGGEGKWAGKKEGRRGGTWEEEEWGWIGATRRERE
jgi:hypothetical protein